MRRFLIDVAIMGIIAFLGAAAVVGFGLYNVSAHLGHLPGVSWVLHTTFRQSVQLRAPEESEVPDLSQPGLIELGAGHYESACAFCHGVPGEAQSETVRSMVPHPPPVRAAIEHWEPQHLFWIVENGVKMTGMPGWPTEKRSDDVWAVVAFLMATPDMSAQDYWQALGRERPDIPSDGPSQLVAECGICHGDDGLARGNPVIPRLDILSEEYIAETLDAYRSGARHSGIMQQAASTLEDEEIAFLADHFANADAGSGETGGGEPPDPDLIATGEALAKGGALDPTDETPACTACHGPWPEAVSGDFPSLIGQRRHYVETQLVLWQQEKRGGTEKADMMHKVIEGMDEADMAALAAYYSSLSPAAE